MGAPAGLYLLDDLLAERIAPKLNLFTSVYALDRITRTRLRKLAEKSGAVWCWAPGCIDLDRGTFSIQAVRETTGFTVEELEAGTFQVISTEAGRRAGLPDQFGPDADQKPRLAVRPEKGDIVLATYRDGKPAVVLRPGTAPQLFCGTTELPPPLLRHMAELSGVQIFTDRPANVYANPHFRAVNAPEDGIYRAGERQLHLKKGETAILP